PEVRAMAPLMDRFDMRFHPDHIGWAVGQPLGEGVMSAWFQLAGGREPDPISLLTVVDALPPVTFNLGMPGWAPTLELTAHVRAKPAPGWLKVRHVTRNMAGGMFEEDCEVWDSTGRLVAQSRQLARQPRP
ncbi:MAG: thioesterase family protein, partial [Nocardioides sp.]